MVITLTWLECGYRNSSDRMVIARCIGPEQFFLERVVFPFELLSFSCPPDSELKIWTHGLGGPELLESHDVAGLAIVAPADSGAMPEAGPAAAVPEPGSSETPASGAGLAARGLGFGGGQGNLVEVWVPAG